MASSCAETELASALHPSRVCQPPSAPASPSCPASSAWISTLTVSPQMGALVGSLGTDVTALEIWFLPSSDAVFLGWGGRGRLSQRESTLPVSLPSRTPPSVNLSKGWTEHEELLPRQRHSCHPRPLSAALLPE